MMENEMVGWHQQLCGHEFEQAPGAGDGQGSLVCYIPWGHKEWDIFLNIHLNFFFSILCKEESLNHTWVCL